MNQSATIVQRLWNYCNVLRDDGMSYGDYLEQLTYLLFLKMDDERARELGLPSAIPADYNWASLTRLDGDALETHYRNTLMNLGKGSGLIPVIFRKAQNKAEDQDKWLVNGVTLLLAGPTCQPTARARIHCASTTATYCSREITEPTPRSLVTSQAPSH